MLENGSVIDGKYKILNKIGQGGMSMVYLAMNERANKQWAIKEVRKDVTHNFEVVRQGLITETNMLKMLNHPNLPSIIDVIEEDDTLLIVMDYIEGVTLKTRIEERGAQSQEEVIDWALQLCDVLSYLHSKEKPIIYRDMKPGNIMLKPNGDLVLIDFGIAREFKSQNVADTTCLGTQGYAAPEQFGGMGQTDQRTDIYCLGTTLYHLLTNHNPSEPPYEIYPIRKWDETLSPGLEEIIIKCTQRNPDDRYKDCNELRYALEHYMELDSEFKKKEDKQFKSFMLLGALTFLFLGMGLFFQISGDNLKKEDYADYLQKADSAFDKESTMQMYERAIDLDPSRGDAYMALLNFVMEDDKLDEDEAYEIRKMLQDSDGNTSNEEMFRQGSDLYDEFAYQMGMAYFYSFEESGNKNNARKWLAIAAESTQLEESKVERSKILLGIAEYYQRIGVQSKSGDESVSYKDYWEDLVALSEGNIVQKDNAVTALMIYNELIFQVATNASKFDNASIDRTVLVSKIKDVIAHIDSDIGEADLEKERVQYLLQKVAANTKIAERELETQFSIMKEAEEDGQ